MVHDHHYTRQEAMTNATIIDTGRLLNTRLAAVLNVIEAAPQSAVPAEGKRLVYDVLREMFGDLGTVKTMLDAYAMQKSGREHIEAVEDIAYRRLRQRPSSRQPMGSKVVPAAHGPTPAPTE
jgi:hypothetical protein